MDPNEELVQKLEEIDDAIDTMKNSVRAGTIAEGLLNDFRQQVDDLRRAAGVDGDDRALAVVSAIDRVAAAVAAANDDKAVDLDVVRVLDDLADDMGYEEEQPAIGRSRGSEPSRRDHDWISPLVVKPGDPVSIYGSNLENVSVGIDGTPAPIEYQGHDVIVFTAPRAGKGNVVVSGGGLGDTWTAQLSYTRPGPQMRRPPEPTRKAVK